MIPDIKISVVTPTDPELEAASNALGEAIIKFVEATVKPYVGMELDDRTFLGAYEALESTCGTVIDHVNRMRLAAQHDLNVQMSMARVGGCCVCANPVDARSAGVEDFRRRSELWRNGAGR